MEKEDKIKADILAIKAEGVYDHVFYVKGKGYCGIHQYVFTAGLAVNITYDHAGDYWIHDYRFCYPPAHLDILALTLLAWSKSKIDVVDDPQDDKWIKKKGADKTQYYDDLNPKIKHKHIE